MPLPVSISGREWAFVLPALSAQCRLFLGVPFNIASYALLTLHDRRHLGLKAGEVHTLGDAIFMPIILNKPAPSGRQPTALPKLVIRIIPDHIDGFKFEDFEIVDYVAAPHIAAPIAVWLW